MLSLDYLGCLRPRGLMDRGRWGGTSRLLIKEYQSLMTNFSVATQMFVSKFSGTAHLNAMP